MTLARQIIPGSIYLITRRCSERRYFLAPTRAVNEFFGYLLAVQAEVHGMELLGAVQMSNHYHAVVHDVHGNLPAFMRDLHSLTARGLNRLRNRVDGFWDVRQPAVTELCDPESVMNTLVYLACNPVEAGLTKEGAHWPGLRTSPFATTQKPQVFLRPAKFFREDSILPTEASLALFVPPTHRHLSPQQFGMELARRVQRRETEIGARFSAEGRQFARLRDLSRISWNDAPRTEDGRFELSPRVIAKDGERRRGVLARTRNFLRAYHHAFDRFRGGGRDATFPGGTWGMAKYLSVDVEVPPSPAWLM